MTYNPNLTRAERLRVKRQLYYQRAPRLRNPEGWLPRQRMDNMDLGLTRDQSVSVAVGGATPQEEDLGEDGDLDGEIEPTASAKALTTSAAQ